MGPYREKGAEGVEETITTLTKDVKSITGASSVLGAIRTQSGVPPRVAEG